MYVGMVCRCGNEDGVQLCKCVWGWLCGDGVCGNDVQVSVYGDGVQVCMWGWYEGVYMGMCAGVCMWDGVQVCVYGDDVQVCVCGDCVKVCVYGGMVCKKVWYGLDDEEHKLKASLVSIVLAT